MSSELDTLVETITDLVLGELGGLDTGVSCESKLALSEHFCPDPTAPKVLMAAGPRSCDPGCLDVLAAHKGVSPVSLVWDGCGGSQGLPAKCVGWPKVEAKCDWSFVRKSYQGVVLLGADLSVLGSLANLGSGGQAPSLAGVEALASGIPVFVDNHYYEGLRRHSSRLASGFVRRFEELTRLVSSFGVEFGGATQMESFLNGLSGVGATATAATVRSSGRDVITVEDVEAVKRAGEASLKVAMGTIVTPLAQQRAGEWGVEVIFQ